MNALALLIGNAQYINSKDRLINSGNDAEDFGKKLLNLGFIVKKSIDCNEESFDREVQSFGEELKKFDVGLFYFSGHGLQIDGKNYLTSIDTSFVDSVSAKHSSFPLDQVIDYMQQANPIIKILILDACRNNPLPNQYRSIQDNGLAPIHAPKGTIIAFSTSPGETAMDYGSGRNSIYTGSLLNHIDDTNIPIEDFFKRVRTSVFTLSNGKQTSWEHTSLNGNLFEIYFNSKGQFRQTDFKNELIDEIFKLQLNKRYELSFQFIIKQLAPFSEFLFYIPSSPPTALPIEVTFETTVFTLGDIPIIGHKLISIKHEEVELLEPYENAPLNTISVNYDQFLERLNKELSVPKNMLRLSMNVQERDIQHIYIPWSFKLDRQKK